MKEEFLIGCNYWPSNGGCLAWKAFDEKVIESDMEKLAAYGVRCIRIFPSWEDFQPIRENPIPKSPWFDKQRFRVRVGEEFLESQPFPESGLSAEKIAEFRTLIELAGKNGIKVIVAFLTGWMSGRRLIPDYLKNKDLHVDATAILYECRFIKDFISQIKDYENVIAYEPGNECNCLCYEADEAQSELWMKNICDTIRLADNTRPIYSGIHTTNLQGRFNQLLLSRHVDVLTPHPYPIFTPYCATESVLNMRASLHAACESLYYASVTGKPSIVEEIGTTGPCVLNDELTADYFERSLLTSLAVGSKGYLWWCAFDQNFDFEPYNLSTSERDLGLFTAKDEPKPIADRMKKLRPVLEKAGALPEPKTDATAILVSRTDTWRNAYGAFTLGVQAGRTIDFYYDETPLRDADYYILPCIELDSATPYCRIKDLKARVKNGAHLLVTYDGGGIGDFEELTGLTVTGREKTDFTKTAEIDGARLTIPCSCRLMVGVKTAEVLYRDDEGEVFVAQNKLGKGTVTFVNAPIERVYTESYMPENTALYKIYELFFANKEKIVSVNSTRCMATVHESDDCVKVMLNNYDERNTLDVKICEGYQIGDVFNAKIADGKITFDGSYAIITLQRLQK